MLIYAKVKLICYISNPYHIPINTILEVWQLTLGCIADNFYYQDTHRIIILFFYL